MDRPEKDDFQRLQIGRSAAELRRKYLGTLDLGMSWEMMGHRYPLIKRTEIVRFLYMQVELEDEQIAYLLETTTEKIVNFRRNHGIRNHGPQRVSRDLLGVEEEAVHLFARRWKFTFSPAFDPNDEGRPFFRCLPSEKHEIARAAARLAEYHNMTV